MLPRSLVRLPAGIMLIALHPHDRRTYIRTYARFISCFKFHSILSYFVFLIYLLVCTVCIYLFYIFTEVYIYFFRLSFRRFGTPEQRRKWLSSKSTR